MARRRTDEAAREREAREAPRVPAPGRAPAAAPVNRFGAPAWAGRALTLAGAALGGWAVAATGAPAGWLSGAMIATAAMAMLGVAEPLTAPFRWAAMILSGMVIGSAINREVLAGVAAWPASIAWMGLCVVAVVWVCALALSRLPGWSRQSAFFASVPGALSYVLALAADDRRADLRRVAFVQVLRVFLLMGLAPLAVAESGFVSAPFAPTMDTPMVFLAMLPAAALAAWGLERLKLAGGLLFGAMGAAGAFHLAGFAHGRPPAFATVAAQIAVGVWVGARFIRFDWSMLGRSLGAALGSFCLAVAIAAVFAAAGSHFLGLSFAQAMMAYAPGGLEAMTLLAFALGVDPLFVAAHHLARFLMIALALPLALRLWTGESPDDP